MVRCFVGIFLPEDIKEKVMSMQNRLKALPMMCKMVERENLHICLSFLGEVGDVEVKKISERLNSICERYQKFDVKIDGIKMIPNESYIRVLALDVDGEALKEISKAIKDKIGGSVKPPHLTLCRVKSITDKKTVLSEIRRMVNTHIGSFTVTSISLIKSELHKTGPVYTKLHDANLRVVLGAE